MGSGSPACMAGAKAAGPWSRCARTCLQIARPGATAGTRSVASDRSTGSQLAVALLGMAWVAFRSTPCVSVLGADLRPADNSCARACASHLGTAGRQHTAPDSDSRNLVIASTPLSATGSWTWLVVRRHLVHASRACVFGCLAEESLRHYAVCGFLLEAPAQAQVARPPHTWVFSSPSRTCAPGSRRSSRSGSSDIP